MIINHHSCQREFIRLVIFFLLFSSNSAFTAETLQQSFLLFYLMQVLIAYISYFRDLKCLYSLFDSGQTIIFFAFDIIEYPFFPFVIFAFSRCNIPFSQPDLNLLYDTSPWSSHVYTVQQSIF